MPILPYTLRTATGTEIEFAFRLHAETASPMRVGQLLSSVLDALDRDIRVLGPTSNGDVLQALAMALAARSTMIEAADELTAQLARSLLATALDAASDSTRKVPPSGHA